MQEFMDDNVKTKVVVGYQTYINQINVFANKYRSEFDL